MLETGRILYRESFRYYITNILKVKDFTLYFVDYFCSK